MGIKTRFAPSPTGEMHFGNVRTALFSVLASICQGGSFLLRVEDTDAERSSLEFQNLLYKDLKWLGIKWQEGPDENQEYGDNGPYKQSLRKDIYDNYYDKLLEDNKAYYCFCSEEKLALNRKIQRSQGLPPRYSGTCANLSKDEVKAMYAESLQPTIRFRIDKKADIKFNDVVKGEQVFHGSDIGDFIIRRANGTASFMFCNAIDDSLMNVSLVLRGEDHLTNSPRQIMILNALGLDCPEYGHISLIIGSDNSPLSKRHGSFSIKALREKGYLPSAIINYLARLGHQYSELPYSDIYTLGKNFRLDHLSKSPARYDEQHLLHWQKEAILHIDSDSFKDWLGKIVSICPNNKVDKFVQLMQQNILFPEEAHNWAKILFTDSYDFTALQIKDLQETGVDYFQACLEYVERNSDSLDIKSLTNFLKEKFSLKGKKLFMPLRLGLTMHCHGPELVNLVDLMGVEKVKSRLNNIIELIK